MTMCKDNLLFCGCYSAVAVASTASHVHLKQASMVSVHVLSWDEIHPPQGTNWPCELTLETPSTPGVTEARTPSQVLEGLVMLMDTKDSAEMQSVRQ